MSMEQNFAEASKKSNSIGLDISAYQGGKSTLCAGCGHNVVSQCMIEAFFELSIDPSQVAKFSGIGCSSKSPGYFLSKSYALNAVHGRMPAIATGTILANRKLIALGISGDGDTASIGMGQFIHLLRRNVPMVYVIEDNGVYALTKGQFSATADRDSCLKNGTTNNLPAIDTCALAIEMGASFVARSFVGDKKQLIAILKAAISHHGTALIDVISPCVTFNEHEGSTRSYHYVKDHQKQFSEVEFIPASEVIVDCDQGITIDIRLHSGSHIRLKKIDNSYDPTDRFAALKLLNEHSAKPEILTGIFFIDPNSQDFLEILGLTEEPLISLPEEQIRPSREVLDEIMNEL